MNEKCPKCGGDGSESGEAFRLPVLQCVVCGYEWFADPPEKQHVQQSDEPPQTIPSLLAEIENLKVRITVLEDFKHRSLLALSKIEAIAKMLP